MPSRKAETFLLFF